ncbi:MAG: sensor histidine kinase [Wujia sp.]
MNNKQSLKKCIFAIVLITATIIAVCTFCANRYMKAYNRRNNEKLEAIIITIHEKYPLVSYNEIMGILEAGNDKDTEKLKGNLLEFYGIDLEDETLTEANTSVRLQMLWLCVGLLLCEAAAILICFLVYDRKRDKDINEITKCIENINHKIYRMDVDSNTEDELSILKNEIYKTTIMLKEEAENSKLAKNLLKDSLSDISHQLKTPLTSITVMLDNLYENPEMEVSVRQRFLRNMRREIANINFMVQSLLKLSKLDANTIEFKNEDIPLTGIVEEAIKNISALSDLKNVGINIVKKGDFLIRCDRRWQIEAVSNIIKNSIEHSVEGSCVEISMDDNHVYTSLAITNYGDEINEKDLPHLFERFYRGENAAVDSVGIGLALAKSIVESCGGAITVDSKDEKTTFCIKYFK